MLGIKSSGCFIIGIMTGFVLALFLGAGFVFYFNPDIKQKTLTRVEEIWDRIKKQVDHSLGAAKNAPTAEPAVPANQPSVPAAQGGGGTAPAPAAPPSNRPRIEIKLGI